jgi:hypothetical protein
MVSKDSWATPAKVGVLDYMLAAAFACLAAYSAGMGLGQPKISQLFVSLILVGTTFSFIVNRFVKNRLVLNMDGFLYAAGALGSFFFARELNGLLPEEGFPWTLILGGVMCWMLVFGSFVVWRDSTLLFQAVPGIALFGMVGSWDTYGGSTFAFFGFLLCVATLFARTHLRSMLGQAVRSGFRRPQKNQEAADVEDFLALRAGPWRWVAGPEWGLVSAAAIILVSLIGAPILQETAKPIAGVVNVPIPPQARPNPTNPLSGRGESVEVGRGPQELGNHVVLRARLDRARHLRIETFDSYTGRGWRRVNSGGAFNIPQLNIPPDVMRDYRRIISFSIELLPGWHNGFPAPGYLAESPGRRFIMRTDGTVAIQGGVSQLPLTEARAVVARDNVPILNAPKDVAGAMHYVSQVNVSPKVAELTQQVTSGLTTDYEKAMAIKKEIARRTQYNLKAPAIPSEVDVVEDFLFSTREGYCDLFASSMVIMARAANIPARYVVGYFPLANQREGRTYSLRASDAHAWAELYFENVGWIPFDPTDSVRQVPGGELGSPTASTAWYATPWAIGGMFILGGMGIIVFFWLRREGYVLGKRAPREQVGLAYAGFVRQLERHSGRRKRPSQTPREYIEMIDTLLGPARVPAWELTQGFTHAFYAQQDVTEEDAHRLKVAVKEVSSALKAARQNPSPVEPVATA